MRSRGPVDGAVPSGNSVAAENLLTLAGQLDKPAYREKSVATITSHGPIIRHAPQALPRMAIAVAALAEAE